MSSKKRTEPFVAGWLFWGIICAALSPFGIWLCWVNSESDVPKVIPVGTGLLAAALGSGLITWPINSIMQRRWKRQRIEDRKKAKKK